jgi:hypothetical protein
VIVCFRVIRRIAERTPPEMALPAFPPASQSPFSTGKAATIGPPHHQQRSPKKDAED